MAVTSYLLAGMALLSSLSLQVRIDGMPKGSLVDGPYIPIRRDFAMYFSISNCTSEDRTTFSYCWWKKSCTSWYGPVNVPVFTGFTCLSWCRISSMNSSSSRFIPLEKGWKQVKIWCKSNLAPVDMFTHIYIYYLIYISVFICMFVCICFFWYLYIYIYVYRYAYYLNWFWDSVAWRWKSNIVFQQQGFFPDQIKYMEFLHPTIHGLRNSGIHWGG